MLRKLALALVVASALILAEPALAAGADCSKLELNTTGCPTVTGTIGTDDVTLSGTSTTGDAGTRGGSRDTDEGSPADLLSDCDDPLSATCARPFIATVTAPVTLADIAAFRPSPAVDRMEPNGWTIVGLDTNFYATGGAHVRDGLLLGQPAAVRFTPVTWRWSYGDGSAARHPYPGGTWAAQGAAEFDPTPTSHVYQRTGNYLIDLDVEYTAEYRFSGGPWVEIAGTLTLPTNRLAITVGEAKTVLVERECTRHPAGPGC